VPPSGLNRVSGDEGKTWRGLLDFGYVVDELSRLRISLMADCIGIRAEEGLNVTLQISDVFFSPFDF